MNQRVQQILDRRADRVLFDLIVEFDVVANRRVRSTGDSRFVNETNHFFNLGYGWLCKHCSAEDAERKSERAVAHEKSFGEATAENKQSVSSTLPLARWTDASRQALVCPRCSIEETISKA